MEASRDRLFAIRVTAEELARIDRQAAREDRDRSGLVRRALWRYLDEEEGNDDERGTPDGHP